MFHLWRKVHIQQVISFGQCIIWTKADYIGIEGGDEPQLKGRVEFRSRSRGRVRDHVRIRGRVVRG